MLKKIGALVLISLPTTMCIKEPFWSGVQENTKEIFPNCMEGIQSVDIYHLYRKTLLEMFNNAAKQSLYFAANFYICFMLHKRGDIPCFVHGQSYSLNWTQFFPLLVIHVFIPVGEETN